MNGKQYILSMLVTMKGDKVTTARLMKLEKSTGKVGKTMLTTGKSAGMLSKGFGTIMKRALLTIPVWFALRSAFIGLIRVISGMVTAYMDLDDGMARIATVTHGTTAEVKAQLTVMKSLIKEVAVATRVPLKELAEAFYFLKTAGLSAKEAIDAFIPTVNAMTGTGIRAKEMARAVAGVYNTMGKYILEGADSAEKFRRIADALSYTYATQDVQMSELIQSYTKLAPFIGGLSDSFEDLILYLGFLNTRMLRAGRTGRLTGRAILQITKNADKLASIFKITFDPSKPLSFLGIMEELNQKIKRQGKITAGQTEALRRIFGTRGLVPIQLGLESWEQWQQVIERGRKEMDGFAKKIAELKMATVRGQMQRLSNILNVVFEDFISGIFQAGELAEALDNMNDAVERSRESWKAFGDMIGWSSYNISQFIQQSQIMARTLGTTFAEGTWDLLIPGRSQLRLLEKWGAYMEELTKEGIKYEKPSQYFDRLFKEWETSRVEYAKKRERLEEIERKKRITEEIGLVPAKRAQEAVKAQLRIMKLLGAHALDIARYKMEQLEIDKESLSPAEAQLEYTRRRNELLEAELRYRKEMVNTVQSAEVNMMRAMGATQLQILKLRERQLQRQKENMHATAYQLQLDKLRLQQAVLLQQEKQKEWNAISGLYTQYAKADMFEKDRLRRVMELLKLKPEELASKYRQDMFDRGLVDDYFNNFSEEGQEAINRIRKELWKLPGDIPGELDFIPRFEDMFARIPESFATNWLSRMKEALYQWKADWEKIQATVPITSPEERESEARRENKEMVERINNRVEEYRRLQEKGAIRPSDKVGVTKYIIQVGDMDITVEGDIPEAVANELAREFKRKLLEDDDFVNRVRPKL